MVWNLPFWHSGFGFDHLWLPPGQAESEQGYTLVGIAGLCVNRERDRQRARERERESARERAREIETEREREREQQQQRPSQVPGWGNGLGKHRGGEEDVVGGDVRMREACFQVEGFSKS